MFMFYAHSIGPQVERVLQHYEGKGDVELATWNLPIGEARETLLDK